ncbi:MAG TPA: sodium/glutamate symporter [Burkholderiales bacterium]|nr:sodium/glutamate symporter [Burkholderiales bacterium]
MTARDILLVYFFTVIGINAHASDLVRGGKPLAVLVAVTVAFMFAANSVGVGAARCRLASSHSYRSCKPCQRPGRKYLYVSSVPPVC